MTEQHFIGAWDCKNCGHKKIIGTYDSCPICQKGRPADVKFYLPDDAEKITDADDIEEATSGPDWVCGTCDFHNNATQDVCIVCGSPKSEGKNLEVKTYQEGEVPNSGDIKIKPEIYQPKETKIHQSAPKDTEPKTSTENDHYSKFSSFPEKSKTSPVPKVAIWSIIGLVFAWAMYFFFFATESVNLEVKSSTWQRSIQIEQLQTSVKEDWDDNVPFGARQLNNWQDIRTYNPIYKDLPVPYKDKVEDGTKDVVCGKETINNGNGTFTKKDKICKEKKYKEVEKTRMVKTEVGKEPVYDTKVRYEVDSWVVVRTPTSSGTTNEIYWPKVELGYSTVNGNRVAEREGNKYEKFISNLASNGKGAKTWQYEFKSFVQPGSKFTAQVNRVGSIMSIH